MNGIGYGSRSRLCEDRERNSQGFRGSWYYHLQCSLLLPSHFSFPNFLTMFRDIHASPISRTCMLQQSKTGTLAMLWTSRPTFSSCEKHFLPSMPILKEVSSSLPLALRAWPLEEAVCHMLLRRRRSYIWCFAWLALRVRKSGSTPCYLVGWTLNG